MDFEPPDSFPGPEDDVERKKRESISRRMAERMKELGITAKGLSRAIGAGATYVHEVVQGTIKNPPAAKIASIARELQCSVDYLEGTIATLYASEEPSRAEEPDQIPILGFVEPDTFRKMKASQQEPLVINVRRHPQYPHARHFALDVRGRDMDALRHRGRPAPIFEGTTVICVDMVTGGIPVENGQIYAIERSLDGGNTVERLLRKALLFPNHIELIAESTERGRPAFQVPRDANGTDEVKIIGLVYRWFYNYFP